MTNTITTKPTIAVHDGRFHADDLFACATLQLLLGNSATIIRTRDQSVIAAADYVVDVGGTYNESTERFDHHMTGGAGAHDNGIPFAAFGLVWKKYGALVAGSAEIAARIEKKLVCSVDADDNGVALVTLTGETVPYSLQSFLYALRPTWKESPAMYDASFVELLPLAQKILQREIIIARDSLAARALAEVAYAQAADKRIIVLDQAFPYQEVLREYPEPLFAVLPKFSKPGEWNVEAISAEAVGFKNRKNLPAAWAGLRGDELAKVTGVADAIFCHNGLFLAVVGSRESALKLAQLAVEE